MIFKYLHEVVQTETTLKFIKSVNSLIEKGCVASLAEVSDNLKWSRTSMTSVMKGRRNVPNAIYRLFTDVYKVTEENVPAIKEDGYKEKYIALLEARAGLGAEPDIMTTIKQMMKEINTNSQNIKEVLAGVSSLVLQVQSARGVVLGSLEKIGNLKEGYLSDQVGKTIRRNMKGGDKQGKRAVIHK